MNYEQVVDAGVTLLDKEKASWDLDVVPSRLNMNSTTACVLGQVFGDYDHGLNVLSGTTDLNTKIRFADDHGFRVPDANLPDDRESIAWGDALEQEYEALRDVWLSRLSDRIPA